MCADFQLLPFFFLENGYMCCTDQDKKREGLHADDTTELGKGERIKTWVPLFQHRCFNSSNGAMTAIILLSVLNAFMQLSLIESNLYL